MLENVDEKRRQGIGKPVKPPVGRDVSAHATKAAGRGSRMAGEVDCRIERGVATLTLRRPAARNAITILFKSLA